MESLRPAIRVARGTSVLVAQNITTLVLGVIYFALLARLITPHEMGVLTVLLLVLYLAEYFGNLGLGGASPKYIPDFMGKGDIDGASGVYRRILKVNVLCGLLTSTVCFILAPWISIVLTQSLEYELLFRVLSLSILTGTLSIAFLGFIQGLQRMNELAGVTVIYTTARRFLALLLIYIGFGLFGLIYGWILGDLTAILLSAFLVNKRLGWTGPDFPLTRLLAFSAPILGHGLTTYALQWVDRAFVLVYLPLSDLGIYQVAFYAFSVLGIIPSSIFTALYPQLSELYGRRGGQTIAKAFRSATRYVALAFIPIVLAVITLHRPLIALFAGYQYIAASTPFALMAFGALAWGFVIIINSFFMSLEKSKPVLGVSIVSFVFYFAACLLLVPSFGVIGAAIVRGSLPFITLILGVYVLAKYMPVKFDGEAFLKAFVAAIASSAIVLMLMQAAITYVLLFAYGLVYVLVYILASIALGSIRKSDVDLLENIVPGSTKRLVKYARKLVR